MRKTLLFCSSILAGFTLSAQTPQAVLEDITPAGYNFDQYEAGTQFKLTAPSQNTELNWSLPSGAYETYGVGAKIAQDGQCTIAYRPGDVAANTDDYVANINNGVTVEDFGGTLGKCLVLNQAWSPFEARSGAAEKYGDLGNGYSAGGNFYFYIIPDKEKVQEGWSGAPIRVRIVFNVCRRGRHQTSSETKNVFEAFNLADNGNYYPGTEGEVCKSFPLTGESFAKWEGETGKVEDIPANPVLKQTPDEFQDANKGNYYEWNPDRFMVYEFDVYTATGEFYGAPRICLNIPTINSTFIIKEINISNITNGMELLDADENPIPGASYLNTRHISYRYYNSDIRGSEGESGIGEIIADGDENAPAVYYNLQGVQVNEPANGLYIVRRGSKVTKEVIR